MRDKPRDKQISPLGIERDKGYTMNEFEMIEKLVERENVSFEEARDALRAAGGDLVDAIVYLERKAKTDAEQAAEAEAKALEAMADTAETDEAANDTNNTIKMTANDAAAEEMGEETMKERTRNTKGNTGAAIRGFFRKVKDVLVNNELRITRNGEEKVKVPAWAAAIILVCFFHVSAIAIIVSLFFGCRYAFIGKDDLSRANACLDKAGDLADKVKAQFN